MTPRFTSSDFRDCWLCNMVRAGYGFLPHSSLEHDENLAHVLFGKLCASIFRSHVHSSFSGSVLNVILLRAYEQVFRSATSWNIAFVKNAHAIRYWPIVKNPRRSVGSYFTTPFSSASNLSISEMSERPSPQPARIRFLNLRPESLWERFGKSLRGQVFWITVYLHFNSELIAGAGLLKQRRFISFEGCVTSQP